jgi:uncharacterized protein YlbG (UPF0298 family)
MIQREALIIYYKNPKLIKTIKSFGNVTYYHKKRHYAVVYVNGDEKEKIIKELRAIRGIKYVDESYLDQSAYAFEADVQ